MPDNNSFNTNPSNFVDLNDLFPVLNEKVGLSAEQFQKLVENTFYLYRHLGLADVEVGTIETVYAPPGTPFDVQVTHRDVVDSSTGKTTDYFDYVFTVAVAKITTGMTVERVDDDALTGMTLVTTPLTGDDANKGYHFQFTAQLPRTLGEDEENKVAEITDANKDSTVLYTSVKAVVDYVAENAPGVQVIESHTIDASSWAEASSIAPYTHTASFTATNTIVADTVVELMNDNALLFANYGFAIGEVNAQEIVIYSIGKPAEAVTLKIGIGG